VNKISFDIGSVFFGSDSFPKAPSEVGNLVTGILATLVSFAGAVFIILIVIGGFYMITGAGSGNQQKIGRGRTLVTAAAAGFLVIIGAYLIVMIIEIMTGIAIL
jgi:hypothetical protein